MPPRKKKDSETTTPDAPAKKHDRPSNAARMAAHAKSDDIEVKIVSKDIPQRITDPAVATRLGVEHARVTLEKAKLRKEIADFSKPRRKRLEELDEDDIRLANAVNNNVQIVRGRVAMFLDYKLNQIRYEGVTEDGKPDGKPIPGLEPEVMPVEMRQRTLFEGDGAGPRVAAEEESEDDELEDDDPAELDEEDEAE